MSQGYRRRAGTGGGGGAPSGAAGGALAGTYPNPTLADGTVTNGGLLWNGSAWVNAKLADANIASGAAIAANKIAGTALVASGNLSDLSDARAGRGNLAVDNAWRAQDHGLIAWAYDPGLASSSSLLPTAGTVYLTRLKLNVAVPITNIELEIANAGVTLTAGQCFAALYSGAGAILGVTADQATNWQSSGAKKMPLLSGPFTPPAPGDIFVAYFANGTTLPGLPRTASFAPQTNFNLSAANSRYASADTSRTTSMPATLGALTALSPNFWAAVS